MPVDMFGLEYKEKKERRRSIVQHCMCCGTPLSNQEIADGKTYCMIHIYIGDARKAKDVFYGRGSRPRTGK